MSRKEWQETEAVVYTCGMDNSILGIFHPRHIVDVILGRTFLFSTRYIVVFQYTVNGENFSGEFTSPVESAERTSFSIKYNPGDPEKNDRGDGGTTKWAVAIGVGMSLAWVIGSYVRLHVMPSRLH